MKIVKARAEKGTRLCESLHTTLYKQIGQHLIDADFRSQPVDLFRIGRLAEYPFAVSGLNHILTKLVNYFDIW